MKHYGGRLACLPDINHRITESTTASGPAYISDSARAKPLINDRYQFVLRSPSEFSNNGTSLGSSELFSAGFSDLIR